MFTYDAETLRDKVATDSILTNHRTPPFVLYLLNNFDYSTPRYTLLKQNNFYDDQSGFNALHLPRSFEFISFYALLKEQSPTNNLEMDGLVKIEPSDIYASKYYPSRSNYTDHGHILNLGARIELPVLENWHEPLQLIVFVDSSPITMDQYSWATELNHTTINGAGFGISWTHIDNFSLQVYFANELDNQVLAIPPTLSHLFWVQAVKHF
jgi:hypothetical protein